MPRKPRTRKTARKPAAGPRPELGHGLLRDPGTARPLASLVFLAPLLVFYVIGLLWVRPDLAAGADILIRQGLGWLGVTGAMAPTWMVVLILLVWHLLRRDPWEISWGLVGQMAAEAVLLAVPLLVLLAVFHMASHSAVLLAIGPVHDARGWLDLAMSCIGAGIFEELLFRLLMVGAVLGLVRPFLGKDSAGSVVAVVLISAAVFSGAHVLDHPDRFAWGQFLYRSAAGVYLGFVFFYRGFGVAAGTHILFNLVIRSAFAGA
jgi:hypothetical protein